MLMTKYTYWVHPGSKGTHIVVTRLTDGAQKYFFQTTKGPGIVQFMDSITDELCDGYWPKPKKKKAGEEEKSEVDNWAFLGYGIDRSCAEAMSRIQYAIHSKALTWK